MENVQSALRNVTVGALHPDNIVIASMTVTDAIDVLSVLEKNEWKHLKVGDFPNVNELCDS